MRQEIFLASRKIPAPPPETETPLPPQEKPTNDNGDKDKKKRLPKKPGYGKNNRRKSRGGPHY